MASSFIPRDSEGNLCRGNLALILFFISLIFLLLSVCLESENLMLLFLLLVIISSCNAIAGLHVRNQRAVSIVTLFLSIIVFICVIYHTINIISGIGDRPVEKGVIRSNAKAIQSALECYYAEWGSFPDKNNLSKAFKTYDYMNRAIPIYKNGKPMIKTYKKINDDNYIITFNYYNGGYFEVKNCKLKKNTDTNKLLK